MADRFHGVGAHIAGAAGAAAALVTEQVVDAGRDNLLGYAYSLGAAVLAFMAVLLLMAAPMASSKWRRLVRPEASVEGDWLEIVYKDGRPFYSLFTISYLWREGRYAIAGVAAEADGSVHATWDSTAYEFESETLELRYLYLARQVRAEPANGYVEISFVRRAGGRPVEARGFLVDLALSPVRCEFEAHVVSAALKEELLGSSPVTLDGLERKRFVQAYHDKMQREIAA